MGRREFVESRGEEGESVIRLFESHRMEILAEAFIATLEAEASLGELDPLLFRTVIPQNPVTGRWLSFYLARKTGVSASLDLPLAGRFVRDFFDRLHGPRAGQLHFDRETLLLRIDALLPSLLSSPAFDVVARFAGRGSGELRRYDLAVLLADLYDRSMIYRPELLLAWEEGRAGRADDPDGPDSWQAILWRALAGPDRPLHRARMMLRFLSGEDPLPPGLLPSSLALFGLTGMAPVDLRFFRTLGERDGCEVSLFFLNPSREYWGDIVRSRVRERAPENERSALSVGAPLLSSWGGEFRTIHDSLAEIPEGKGLFYGESPETLLGHLQNDILTLFDRGAEVRAGRMPKQSVAPFDRSVEIVAATGRVREVEMLRDRLLDLFSRDPSLSPEDVVVLAPDIAPYAGIVRSVFSPGFSPGGGAPEGAGGSGRPESGGDPRIPFVVSDRRETDASPAFQALLLLLALPEERITVLHLLRLLSVPSVASRFELTGIRPERLREILSLAGFRWGRDEGDRRELAPSVNTHSFFWGLDRLLLGYACGPGAFPGALPFSPVAMAEDVAGEAAGGLARFLWVVDRHVERMNSPHPASEWPDLLQRTLDAFFDPRDKDPVIALIFGLPEKLAADFARADYHEEISSSLVGRHIARSAGSATGRDRFLSGGVTFGRMVPLRSLPFRVVCLLGLNDGEFPRIQHPPSFDWLAARPCPGDRSQREDDRTLFLEALLSARDALWISYLGRESRDGARREPSVLLKELFDVIGEGFRTEEGGEIAEQITLEAPVDPLSSAHFSATGDPRLHSFSGRWRAVLGEEGEGGVRAPSPVFWEPSVRLPPPSLSPGGIRLREMESFFENPARFFLLRRTGLPSQRREILLPEDEPFTADLRELLSLGAGQGIESGGLPWPPLGPLQEEVAKRRLRQHHERLDRTVDLVPGGRATTAEVALTVKGVRIAGLLEGLRMKADGTESLVLDRWPKKLYASHFVGAYLLHLVASRSRPNYGGTLLAGRGKRQKGGEATPEVFWFWPAGGVDRLESFVRAFLIAQERPLAFDPETSLAYVEALVKASKGKSPEGNAEEIALTTATKSWEREITPFAPSDAAYRDPRVYPSFWSRRLFAGRPLPREREFVRWSVVLLLPLLRARGEIRLGKEEQ